MKLSPQVTSFLLAASVAVPASASRSSKCKAAAGNVEVISIAANDLEDFETVLALYSNILGGANNGNGPPTDLNGHRRINWDGAAVPFDMPGDFFSTGILDRGLTISAKGDTFAVSNPINPDDVEDNLFDSINPDASKGFTTFSAPRLFSPVEDNKLELTFTVPGGNDEELALVSGFGAFFVDVDRDSKSEIIFYDSEGCELVSREVEPNPNGLSFLGLKLDNKVVAKVEVVLGSESLDGEESKAFLRVNPEKGKRKKDIVVMDDFLYDEPTLA